jgi:hypothetical protein
LVLTYFANGMMENVRLPPAAAPKRADDLWRTTCFEAFIRAGIGAEYYEFNFAPSTQWAAYRFTGYREGMSAPSVTHTPSIEVTTTVESFELRAMLDLQLPPAIVPWRLALSAVIE